MTKKSVNENASRNAVHKRHNAVYAYGKLSETVTALAIGAGDIKVRLLCATDFLWAVHPDMLPPDVRPHLVWVREQLTRFESVGSEGSIAATLRRIHRSTGVKIAERIVLICTLMESFLESQCTKKLRSGPEDKSRAASGSSRHRPKRQVQH